ncbi:uncharacterized protein LOC132611564 [Lycium barbarum]|uniref:uncharacterized protein LOC132611564 n=1 Tax=Lycium barbarum TaxID=112863 RepID=UPI00293EDBDD|nr:uncharacterized protein LOC132611564 [Lycium barbarum]
MDIDEQCQLCRGAPETINHAFFACPFSGAIWSRLLQWLNINRSNMEWTDELKWAETWCKGRSSKAEVYKIVLAAAVYYVWQERNNRLFQKRSKGVDGVLRQIAQEEDGCKKIFTRIGPVLCPTLGNFDEL